jgi:hypothetical protein
LIQQQLIYKIKKITGIKIPFQKKQSVFIMMRYTFTNFSLNQNCKFDKQISDLNDKCISLIIKSVLNNMEQYINYIKTLENDNDLLPYPTQTSTHVTNKSFDYSVDFNNELK